MNLITRLDFDGLLSAAMIHDMENIAEINFSTPQALEDGGLLDILAVGDVVAHLPFHPDAGTWFHNHDVAHIGADKLKKVRGKYGVAPSTARQVYSFYNSPKLKNYEALVTVADRLGSASLTEDDILNPKGWVMVSYTLDPRFSDDYAYGMSILTAIKGGKSPEEILALPQVARRVDLFKRDEERYQQELKAHTMLHGNVIITDFRNVERAPRGNRFYVFTQFPKGNVHIRLDDAAGNQVRVAVGKSILNRTCKVNVGRLMEEYGGGGMEGAGTCFVGRKTSDEKVTEIVGKLQG
jgi:hypothetical protein